jgi:hypothetical protein
MRLRRATLAGLVFAATACTTIRRVQPAGYLAQNSPDVVWVTYDNDVVVPVAEAEIRGDTLRGMRQGTQQRVAIPLGQIESVRAKTPDKAKTAILVTGALTGFVASVYALWISKAGSQAGGVDCGMDADAIAIPVC